MMISWHMRPSARSSRAISAATHVDESEVPGHRRGGQRILLPLTEHDSASPKAATAMPGISKTYGAYRNPIVPRVATLHFEVRGEARTTASQFAEPIAREGRPSSGRRVQMQGQPPFAPLVDVRITCRPDSEGLLE